MEIFCFCIKRKDGYEIEYSEDEIHVGGTFITASSGGSWGFSSFSYTDNKFHYINLDMGMGFLETGKCY